MHSGLKTMRRIALIATLLVVAGLVVVPLSSATTIHAMINTKTNEGFVNATSNYALYYTYPNNSSDARQLNGTVIWMNVTSYLNSSGRQLLEGDMNENQNQGQGDSQDNSPHFDGVSDQNDSSNSTNTTTISNVSNTSSPTVHVVNATLKYQMHAFANDTNLTIYRNLTIDLKISNITKKVGNNSTIIDMSWRAFRVQGELMGHFNGKLELKNPYSQINDSFSVNSNMDVNLLGDMGDFGEDGNGFSLGRIFEGGIFNAHVMNYQTIDFHVFSVPLSQWTRVYDSATNTTTLYYNASSNYSLDESISLNGSDYTLKLLTDPSASITTTGKAIPTSSNELIVLNAGAPSSFLPTSTLLIVIAVIALVGIGTAVILMRRRAGK